MQCNFTYRKGTSHETDTSKPVVTDTMFCKGMLLILCLRFCCFNTSHIDLHRKGTLRESGHINVDMCKCYLTMC